MNTEEHDDLWRLLGNAKKTSVSPFFARNILRQIRIQEHAPRSIFGWLTRHWRPAVLGCTALILLAINLAPPTLFYKSDAVTLAWQISKTPDYEVIVHLDELLAYEENSLWLDNPSYPN